MTPRTGWMADTDEKAFAKLVEIQRRMNPGDKLFKSLEAAEMMMRMAEADVRRLHPDASEREVFLRAAARRLGRETIIRACGWYRSGGEASDTQWNDVRGVFAVQRGGLDLE